MGQQQINEGAHLITKDGVDDKAGIVTLDSIGTAWVSVNGWRLLVKQLIEDGNTFTPLVALTPDVVEALMACVVVMEEQGHTLTAQKIRGLLPKEGNNND